jgi:phosphoglycerate dehydrogenase-like enzyme
VKIVAIAPASFAPLELLRKTGVEAGGSPAVWRGLPSAPFSIQASDDPEALRNAIPEAEIILIHPRLNPLLRELWPLAKNLKWVHTLAAGVDTLLFDELCASDVIVTNAKGVFSDALAEFAIAAMLWFAKRFDLLRKNQLAHEWKPFDVERLEATTCGIVGYGSIGQAVGRRAEALGMHVIPFRRTSGNLDDLLAHSDYIVVSTPLTNETRNLIAAPQFARMKPNAVIVNIGRGPVIDEASLIDALREHRIRGAALDVFTTEPLPPDHPLWSIENVLISPHSADHTSDAHERAMQFFLENLEHYAHGETPANAIDRTLRY